MGAAYSNTAATFIKEGMEQNLRVAPLAAAQQGRMITRYCTPALRIDIPPGGMYDGIGRQGASVKNPDQTGIQPLAVAQPYLDPASAQALAHRLARIEGHVRSPRQMVFDHRCADEVLLQVAAVKAALSQVASQIVDRELTACMNSCMEGDGEDRLQKVT